MSRSNCPLVFSTDDGDDDDDDEDDDEEDGEKNGEDKVSSHFTWISPMMEHPSVYSCQSSASQEEDEVGNLQLAWEMLEVAKVIYKR